MTICNRKIVARLLHPVVRCGNQLAALILIATASVICPTWLYAQVAMSTPSQAPVRARDLGVPFDGTPGTYNAITDVPGVEVGYKTLISGEGRKIIGVGPVRTGVTAILPRGNKNGQSVFAGFFAGNGNGDMTGTHWIEESGVMETPILITNTLSVGVVRDAAVAWMTKQNRPGNFWYPVVAETADALLNDIKGQHVTKEDALDALNSAASGPIAEGNVGGGTGMRCNGFKGGSGTSSRRIVIENQSYTVGVFAQCNYGGVGEFRIAGIPVAREMKYQHPCFTQELTPTPESITSHNLTSCDNVAQQRSKYPYLDPASVETAEEGSIIVIVATDAPLTPEQLNRLARRVPLGLGRAGSMLADNSGDLFLAFSTANEGADNGNSTAPTKPTVSKIDRLLSSSMNLLFLATLQATEEAVDNAMVAATPMVGADYILIPALPHDELRRVLLEHKLLSKPFQKQ